MFIRKLELWAALTNSYVVASAPDGPAVVIDAPPECSEDLVGLLARHSLNPVALLITHGHVDHIGGGHRLVKRTGVAAYVHPDDEFLLRGLDEQLRSLMGYVPSGDFRSPDRLEDLKDGMSLELAGIRFEVLATPGHTPGHCCFLVEDDGVLFSGDHLFAGSVGRTDLPGGDHGTLMRSMREKVLPLDDHVWVLPGHGPETTIGEERRSNPFLGESG